MTVTVRLFAILRERARTSSLPLELPSDATVASAVGKLAVEFPAIEKDLRSAAFAVNRHYAARGTSLVDGDELAIIPPVSGG